MLIEAYKALPSLTILLSLFVSADAQLPPGLCRLQTELNTHLIHEAQPRH